MALWCTPVGSSNREWCIFEFCIISIVIYTQNELIINVKNILIMNFQKESLIILFWKKNRVAVWCNYFFVFQAGEMSKISHKKYLFDLFTLIKTVRYKFHIFLWKFFYNEKVTLLKPTNTINVRISNLKIKLKFWTFHPRFKPMRYKYQIFFVFLGNY